MTYPGPQGYRTTAALLLALATAAAGCSESAGGSDAVHATAAAPAATAALTAGNPAVAYVAPRVDPGTAGPVDFGRDVRPVLEKSCLRCHGPRKKRGELRLDKRTYAEAGGESGVVIVPGRKEASVLFERISLPEDHDDYMPSKGDPLTAHQVALIGRWIDEGAAWPDELP